MLSLFLFPQKTSELVPRCNRAIASTVVGSKLVVFIRYYHRYKAGAEHALRSAEIIKCPLVTLYQYFPRQYLEILQIKF